MKLEPFARFISTNSDYAMLLEAIEEEVNRCAGHACAVETFSRTLIEILSTVTDPDGRDHAALLLVKIESLADAQRVAEVELSLSAQPWLPSVSPLAPVSPSVAPDLIAA